MSVFRQLLIANAMNGGGNPLAIPLTLTAAAADSTVTLNAYGPSTQADLSGLQYRVGISGDWLPYLLGSTLTLAAIGDAVQFRNTKDTLSTGTAAKYVQFAMTGSIAASGNLMSMLNGRADCPSYCFVRLFKDCVSLVQAPSLPSSTLGIYSYSTLFGGCSALDRIEVNFTEWGLWTYSWVSGVAAAGTFVKPAALPEEIGNNRIPTGWTVVNK